MTLAKCALIVLIGLVFYFGIEFYSKLEVESIAKRTFLTQKRLIELQQDAFRSESDIAASIIFDDELRKKMYDLENGAIGKDGLSRELHGRYFPIFKKLSGHGLYRLQFYLPDGSPLLCAGSREPCKVSPLSRLGKSRKSPVYGFEIGRDGGAYRAVYPLFYRGEYVGGAEISFAFEALKKALEKVSKKACRFALALENSLLQKRVDKSVLKTYRPCFVDPDFSVSGDMLKDLEVLKRAGYRAPLLPYREFFSLIYDDSVKNGQYYTASFLPLSLAGGDRGGYYIIIHKDDGAIAQVMSMASILYWALALLVFVSLVLTVMVHIYRLKAHAANIDSLTGIYNRRGCLKRLKNGNGRYALLYIDIDHFKEINDKYGHETGDNVLKEVVHIISAHIRKDDVFCRHGGEEFLLFVANANEAQAAAVAEKLRKHIQIHRFEKVGDLTVSVGVAVRERNESIGSLIARADKNLYRAKNGGRNRVVGEETEK